MAIGAASLTTVLQRAAALDFGLFKATAAHQFERQKMRKKMARFIYRLCWWLSGDGWKW
jgi:hypothetical protein